MSSPGPADSSQWVSIHIRDRLENGNISIKESLLAEGQFHSPENPTKTLPESAVDDLVIPANGIGEVCARGRRGSEGWLDLFDGENKICELYWDNREGKAVNDFEVLEGDNQRYRVECSGWSPAKGPLGHVYVDISDAKGRVGSTSSAGSAGAGSGGKME